MKHNQTKINVIFLLMTLGIIAGASTGTTGLDIAMDSIEASRDSQPLVTVDAIQPPLRKSPAETGR